MGDASLELRDWLASARALVEELADEGVDAFESAPAEALAAPFSAAEPPPAAVARPLPAPEDAPRPEPAEPTEAPAAAPQPGVGASLEAVRESLGDCRRCDLCEGRRRIVFGDGNPDADIMFIGEGPGEQEDLRGLPFVGRAGELLTQMIEKGMEITRADTYICNIVKCRPPNNRNPLPPEVAACRRFLDGQIDAVAPRVIVTLGKPAASLLLDRDVAITRERGTWQTYRDIPLMPTLHPAYVLRQYTPENRRAVWEDLKAALARSREG